MVTTLKDVFNISSPQTLPSAFQTVKLGDILRSLPTKLTSAVAVASSYAAAAVLVAALPDDAKASAIFAVYAKAGAGTPGPLALAAAYPPVAGEYSITPSGDIAFAVADAWTSVDVMYLPEQYDVVELTCSVIPGTGVAAVPLAFTTPGMSFILEAEALLGGSVGKKIIDAAGTATAAGHARLNAAKSQAIFATADAVTSGRLKLAIKKSVDLSALLEAASGLL